VIVLSSDDDVSEEPVPAPAPGVGGVPVFEPPSPVFKRPSDVEPARPPEAKSKQFITFSKLEVVMEPECHGALRMFLHSLLLPRLLACLCQATVIQIAQSYNFNVCHRERESTIEREAEGVREIEREIDRERERASKQDLSSVGEEGEKETVNKR
jgi:hypothetical protein